MVDYVRYADVHPILLEIEAHSNDQHYITELLRPIYTSSHIFYHSSEAIHHFIKRSIEICDDPEILDLIWSKIEHIELKLQMAVKLNSQEKLTKLVEAPYFYIDHTQFRFLLASSIPINVSLMAGLLDSLQYPSMIVRVASEVVINYNSKVISILVEMTNYDNRAEFWEVLLEQGLIGHDAIFQEIGLIQEDDELMEQMIPYLKEPMTYLLFQSEIQNFGYSRFRVIKCIIGQIYSKRYLSEMRLILPGEFFPYIQIQMANED